MTNCSIPCQTFRFSLTHVMHDSFWKLEPERDPADIDNNLMAVFVATFNLNPIVQREREVKSYSFNSFISDSGGLLGLFLGLSFWDVYKILVTWQEKIVKRAGYRQKRIAGILKKKGGKDRA